VMGEAKRARAEMQLMHVAEISSTKSNVTVVTTCHKMAGMSGTNQQSTKLEVRPVNLMCAAAGSEAYLSFYM